MSFSYSVENLKKAQEHIAKYPSGKQASAVLPLLDLAQRQNDGWLSTECMMYVGDMLTMPFIRVYEVASFYTMFNLKPIGKYHIQICGTTPCSLCGAADIIQACENYLGIKVGQTTDDGLFTLREVECLGACINAPMMQLNDEFIENLTPTTVVETLEKLKTQG